MRQLTKKDLLVIVSLAGLAAAIALIWIAGQTTEAAVLLAVLVAGVGILSRVQFAARRGPLQRQQAETRSLRRAVERAAKASGDQVSVLLSLRRQLEAWEKQGKDIDRRLENDASTNAASLSKLSLAVNELLAETRAADGRNRQSAADVDDAVAALSDSVGSISASVRELQRNQERLRESVSALRTQVRMHSYSVVNDMQGLAQLLSRYTPTVPLPLMSGWALGPAGLVFLLHAIERDDVQIAVECGSGTSTLWMALAMRDKGSGRVIALEHSEEYARRTRAMLEQHGLEQWAEVRLCPLVPTSTPRGEFQWYDLGFAELPQNLDLVLVDGPPGATGRHARYPAGPILGSRVRPGGLIMVDDADRPDERETVQYWLESETFIQVPPPDRGVAVLVRAGSASL